jgi:hypothetical protein
MRALPPPRSRSCHAAPRRPPRRRAARGPRHGRALATPHGESRPAAGLDSARASLTPLGPLVGAWVRQIWVALARFQAFLCFIYAVIL